MENLATLVEDLRFEKLDIRLLHWIENLPEYITMITHEELASHLGTSREVISRLLKKFEQDGLIKLGRGKIIKVSLN